MAITLNGTTGITTPTYGGSVPSEYITPVTSFKNRIINGAMTIDQRNAGASVNNVLAGTGTYTLDRWAMFGSVATKFSIQRNAGAVTPPAGFSNYLGVTSLSSYSVPVNEIYEILHKIEGYNTADLNWGTADAKTVTISFWVRSSLTGTFGGALKNTETPTRSYPFTYTISSANTWEYKTITIAGDTSGTWLGATNGTGIQIVFGLGVGSTYSNTAGAWADGIFVSATGATSVVGTNGATFYITGIQIEVGSTATSFDYRPYGTELQLCQRYFGIYDAIAVTSAYTYSFALPASMRASPTCTTTVNTGAGSAFSALGGGVSLTALVQSTANNVLATATVKCNAEL
jgi:hypothetical protein